MRFLSLSIVLLISACSSAPPAIQYYLLAPPAAPTIQSDNQSKTMRLSLLPLPDYLQQDGLVMRTTTGQLQVSRQHLWAQSLQRSMPMTLADALNAKGKTRFITSAEPQVKMTEDELRIQIRHLLIDQQQGVVLQARYWHLDGNGQVKDQQDFFASAPLEADGYPHAVAQMHGLLEKLAQHILQQL
ncbi:membrane integrity-associated transporter subunit PqiC [Bowmanella denitrificans]|uniref:Membrane integrity-associated transporter subunit PqiC n=1 Tax=Bowmanella denitrificans TaxID=366582 RepID=A0ABP3HC50_9ALTE